MAAAQHGALQTIMGALWPGTGTRLEELQERNEGRCAFCGAGEVSRLLKEKATAHHESTSEHHQTGREEH